MSISPVERHQQTQLDELRRRYNVLTTHIAAVDTDIGRALDGEQKLVLQERRAELQSERNQIIMEMSEIDPPVEIPVVVVAMTHKQAAELVDGSLFAAGEISLIEHKKIQELCDALQSEQILNWQDHYGDEPDGWKLHTDPETTIGSVLERISDHVNLLQPPSQEAFLGKCPSLSNKFFDQDHGVRTRTWNRLIKIGGVIIIDAISLFHPLIRDNLLQSGVLASSRVALLVLPPVSLSRLEISSIIERHVQSRLQMFFSRFDGDLDDTCEITNGDTRSIRRWLVQTLPRTRVTIQTEIVKTNQNLVTERVSIQSRGIENAIFGRGYEK